MFYRLTKKIPLLLLALALCGPSAFAATKKKKKKKKKRARPVPVQTYQPLPQQPLSPPPPPQSSAYNNSAYEGSTHTYQYDVRISIDPLPFPFSTLDLMGDYQVMDMLTIGPRLSLWRYSDTNNMTGFGAGVRANWYPISKALNTGPYVGPSLNFAKISLSDTAGKITASGSIFAAEVTGGYHYFLENGVNFMGGLGLGYGMGSSPLTATSGTLAVLHFTGLYFVLELSAGYAF